jgi:hypothetical protein
MQAAGGGKAVSTEDQSSRNACSPAAASGEELVPRGSCELASVMMLGVRSAA